VDAGAGNGTVKLEGGSAAFTNADIQFVSNAATNVRGSGIYAYDVGGGNEWYFGRPYATSDSFAVHRKVVTGHDGSVANTVNALFTISSGGLVGIGEIVPQAGLHVKTGTPTMAAPHTNSDELFVEAVTNAGITISAGTQSSLYFGDAASSSVGQVTYLHSSNRMNFSTNNSNKMYILSNGDVGINEVAPLGKLHIKTSDVGAISPSVAASELVLENSGNGGMTIYTGNTNSGYIVFADVDSDTIGQFYYAHLDDSFTWIAGGTVRMKVKTGLVIGAPTGGDKGVGTLNAVAVWDNGVDICFPFEAANTGDIDIASWDALAPNTFDEDGNEIEVLAEQARLFKTNMARNLDVDLFSDYWKTKGHLPAFPSKLDYQNGVRISLGDRSRFLQETVEIQAIHIDALNQKNKDLEAKYLDLEARLAALEAI